MPAKVDINMNADMPKDMIDDAKEATQNAIEKYTVERDIATAIKRDMERKYKGVWQCCVGRNFGTFVTHETKSYINFQVGPLAVVLYRSSS